MPNGPAAAAAVDDDAPQSRSAQTEAPAHDGEQGEGHAIGMADQAWPRQRLGRKRKDMLSQFVDALDFLILVELAALYYQDTSTLLLLLRIATHAAPLHTALNPPTARPRPSLPIVFLANGLALLVHLLAALPTAGDATRNDLHGHLFVDLIGQRCPQGWRGRMRLVAADLLVFGLQVLAVGVAAEVDKGNLGIKRHGNRAVTASVTEPGGDEAGEGEEGIELQPMLPRTAPPLHADSVGAELDRSAQVRTDSLEEPVEGDVPALRELDRLYSGQATLLTVDVGRMMLDHYLDTLNRRMAGRV